MNRRAFTLTAALFASLLSPAHSQSGYPHRPVTIIVPLGPGNGTDIMARELADGLSRQLGKPFIVENRPGANGATAAESVARATPDGYTLMMGGNGTHSANPHLFSNIKYDPVRDFVPLARLVTAGAVLVVSPRSGLKSIADIAARAKAGTPVSYATSSAGSQVAAEKLKAVLGIEVARVPYRSGPQALADIISGNVTFTFIDVAGVLPGISGGQLLPLAISSAKRSALLPDVPTAAEILNTEFDVTFWTGLFAPANTPRDVVETLDSAVAEVLRQEAVQTRVRTLGLDLAPLRAAETPAYVDTQLVRWGELIRQSGLERN